MQSLRIQLQKKLATFDELNEKAAQIHFLSDVFVVVAIVFALSSFLRSDNSDGNENVKKAVEILWSWKNRDITF